LPFSIIFLSWLVVLFINDLYDLKTSYNTSNLINTLFRVFIINASIAVILFYFITPFIDSIRPQRVLLIDLAFSLILLIIWRKVFYKFIKSSNIANHVLIIGQTPLSELLKHEINRRPQLGYKAKIIPQASEDLPMQCMEDNIDILISAYDLKNHPNTARKIFDCLPLGVDVYNVTSFYEQITNKIPVEYIEHSWFLENLAEHSKKLYEITKRFSDIAIAIIGLIVAIPLTPFIALAVKLGSSGPIIFKQKRIGKNGKPFLAMKFRSMVEDAEKNGAEWAQKNDPRVTKFGSFMRKSRLDEIPQLINILRGEMSLIGPRPERPEFVEVLEKEIPFFKERLLVKPGLAGWAQLYGPAYGGSKKESLDKIKYDLYYIKNRSLILDLSILFKTIKVVFDGKGQ
jgi:exopolysaccharide biosynthesis polyprenyl glycosylphosphotransferase